MKKSEFKKLVSPLIKEELYKILGEVLPTLLSEVLAEQVVPQKSSHTQSKPTPHKESKVKFSDNPLLNEVLSQTHGGISDGTEMVSLDKGFDPIGGEEMPVLSTDHGDTAYSAGDHGQKMDLQELQQIAPGVASALTRDYSSLLKAVDSKRSSSSPSNIDFTNYNG